MSVLIIEDVSLLLLYIIPKSLNLLRHAQQLLHVVGDAICYFVDLLLHLIADIVVCLVLVLPILHPLSLLVHPLLLLVSLPGLCLLPLGLFRVFPDCVRGVGLSLHLFSELAVEPHPVCFAEISVELGLLGAVEVVHELLSE